MSTQRRSSSEAKSNRKSKIQSVSTDQEKQDLESAMKASSGFANPYGEEDPLKEEKLKKLFPEDEEFDFGLEDLGDDEEDIEEIKKSFRH